MDAENDKSLTEREIDELVVSQANDKSAWEKPASFFASAGLDENQTSSGHKMTYPSDAIKEGVRVWPE